MAQNQQYQRTGSFVQTTQIWGNEDDKTLLTRLYQNVNQIAVVLNTKETGAYYQQEFVTGALFFPNPNNLTNVPPTPPVERQVSRIVINFGALPAAGTKSVPHRLDIGPQWTFVKIYGCATNPGTRFIPLPYVSALAANTLELSVDMTNVSITTGGTNYSAFTMTYVILEFITL